MNVKTDDRQFRGSILEFHKLLVFCMSTRKGVFLSIKQPLTLTISGSSYLESYAQGKKKPSYSIVGIQTETCARKLGLLSAKLPGKCGRIFQVWFCFRQKVLFFSIVLAKINTCFSSNLQIDRNGFLDVQLSLVATIKRKMWRCNQYCKDWRIGTCSPDLKSQKVYYDTQEVVYILFKTKVASVPLSAMSRISLVWNPYANSSFHLMQQIFA